MVALLQRQFAKVADVMRNMPDSLVASLLCADTYELGDNSRPRSTRPWSRCCVAAFDCQGRRLYAQRARLVGRLLYADTYELGDNHPACGQQCGSAKPKVGVGDQRDLQGLQKLGHGRFADHRLGKPGCV